MSDVNPNVPPEARKIIAKYLKDTREELGLSCEQLAAKIGVTRSTIWRIEEGRYSPNLDLFLAITQALNCYFFIESKESKSEEAEWLRTKWTKNINPN